MKKILKLFKLSSFFILILILLSKAYALETKHVDIWSDGTRMSGDIFFPLGFNIDVPNPAIIMAHGWGGKRSDLNRYFVPKFVKAGFIVLTFDSVFAEEEAAEIWSEKEPENEQSSETNQEKNIIIKTPILSDDREKITIQINEQEVNSNPAIIGIFDPDDNNFSLGMWLESDGDDIKRIFGKSMKNRTVSRVLLSKFIKRVA